MRAPCKPYSKCQQLSLYLIGVFHTLVVGDCVSSHTLVPGNWSYFPLLASFSRLGGSTFSASSREFCLCPGSSVLYDLCRPWPFPGGRLGPLTRWVHARARTHAHTLICKHLSYVMLCNRTLWFVAVIVAVGFGRAHKERRRGGKQEIRATILVCFELLTGGSWKLMLHI